MKLEDQVCSLELAKRLKELGVSQESAFFWNTHHFWLAPHKERDKWQSGHCVSAFTVAELGEMFCTGDELSYKFKTYRAVDGAWWIEIRYTENRLLEETQMFSGSTEADARAKMSIYLLENKLLRDN